MTKKELKEILNDRKNGKMFEELVNERELNLLSSANLGNANLKNANLSEADLGNANLSEATLGNANLGEANLRNANLGDADLGNADLGVRKLVMKEGSK